MQNIVPGLFLSDGRIGLQDDNCQGEGGIWELSSAVYSLALGADSPRGVLNAQPTGNGSGPNRSL